MDTSATTSAKNKRTRIILLAAAVMMFGFAYYVLVPMYNVLCSAFGLNGKPNLTQVAAADDVDMTRTVKVQFIATNNSQVPWKFYPKVRQVSLHPGENKRVAYFGENFSATAMTVQAIPSITPARAAKYLKKTECFCFRQQTLASHKHMDMPILFHLDPALPKDIKTITLSYTLFDTTSITHPLKRPQGRLSG